MENKGCTIEVVYANAVCASTRSLQVAPDCTVESAIIQSGILSEFPEIDLRVNKVGIFSKIIALNAQVQEGDRIEIYRPLLIDPKQARKQRAKK